MSQTDPKGQGVDLLDEADLESAYGEQADSQELIASRKRADFKPWHHPAKQFVRERQWLVQVERLGSVEGKTVGYLSLPGEDMFDVRVIGESVKRRGGKIKLLGFNSRNPEIAAAGNQMNAESVLRQEGIITDDSITLPDRLQDLAANRSHVYEKMVSHGKFDVVNLDLCDHLGAEVNGPSIFDVIERVVSHQRGFTTPWLFMLTTRVHPSHLALAQDKFSIPIQKNIDSGPQFSAAVAEMIGGDISVAKEVEQYWALNGDPLLKVFAVGLGKYLLHLLHNQIQDPSSVELASCCGYRVEAQHLDMLSVVFRVTPGPKRLVSAAHSGGIEIPCIEIESAMQIVRKASGTVDIDRALQDSGLLLHLVKSTEELLHGGNYDVSKYREWLGEHRVRPHHV